MPRTGRPGRINECIVKYLLDIFHELRIAVVDVEVLHIRSGSSNHVLMTGTECSRDIALEHGGGA